MKKLVKRSQPPFNKKTIAAYKKLFDALDKIDSSIVTIAKKIKAPQSGLYNAKRLSRALSPFDVVDLCILTNGIVLPHELRPDIFKPELIQLYRSSMDAKCTR
jgi:hypothetical protein